MNSDTLFQIVIIASAVLMIASILLQQRGASLGAGSGSSGELYTTRRGLDKSLYRVTIVLAFIFVLAILAGMLLPESSL